MLQRDTLPFYRQFALLRLAKHLHCSSELIKTPKESDQNEVFDFSYEGKNFDMKIASPVSLGKAKKQLFWDFDLRTKKVFTKLENNNFYLLIGTKENLPVKMFVINFHKCPPSHVRISTTGKSKYSQYEI